MGSDVTCRSRKVSWRRVPEDIGCALGVAAADTVCVIKCHWSVNGDPAAISTTYLTREAAAAVNEAAESEDLQLDPAVAGADTLGGWTELGQPVALHLEMQPPPSSVARGLRLRAGQPAAMVTVRFDNPVVAGPVALTVAALRPDLFRIVIDSPAEASPVKSVAFGDAFDEATASAGTAGSSGLTAQGSSSAGDVSGVNDAPISYLTN